MSAIPQYLVSACASFLLVGAASIAAAPTGSVEGHLKIISPKEVELADETPSNGTNVDYAEYPLIVLTRDGKKEIAHVAADECGHFRVALSAGDYVLDVKGRRPKGHFRAKPQAFTVISNQTVRVNMNIDSGVR